MKQEEYTICITNFKRPEHLRRCLESVKNLKNVVVATYGATEEHKKIIKEVRPQTRHFMTPDDHGENRLLLQAVALADTPWVVILHDDDQLVPEFAQEMGKIDPKDAGFIGWDGLTEWYGKKPQNPVYPWGKLASGFYSTVELLDTVTKPNGGMVKSPVTMMLRRELAMAVLSWCETGLAEFHTRPKMLIGNEIALLFGHVKRYARWYHVDRCLVRFGHWDGSETCQWLNGVNPKLIELYDGVRTKLGGEQFVFRRDKIVPILVHVHTTGGDNPRKPLAKQTWDTEWTDLAHDYLIVPLCLYSEDMPRTSDDIGDQRKIPYVKDLFRIAKRFTYNHKDVVMLTNDDICFTKGGLRPMVDRTLEYGSTYAHRRTFHETELAPLGLKSLSRILTPEEAATGRRHSGTDTVLVTREWWENVGELDFPDFLIGCEAWDTVFIMISRLTGSGWGFKNTTYHEYHGGWWEDPARRFHNKGQLHNRKLAKDILLAYGIYRGEFEPNVKQDPAYPKHPPGCDTDPDVPVVKYIGASNVIQTARPKPQAPKPPPANAPLTVAPSTKWTPEPFVKPTQPRIKRAIVYPWKAMKAQWHELRYSLRSIEAHFEDKDCPIIILGTERPNWLSYKGRAQFHDCWTYADAIVRGTQWADEILWMNDDILMLKPCGWDDFRPARHIGRISRDEGIGLLSAGNSWRRGLGRSVVSLYDNGAEDVWNYSAHIPYIYCADAAMEVFTTYGVWEKIPMETLYMNHFRMTGEPIGGFKVRDIPFGDATVLNYTDGTLQSQAFRHAIEALLPDPCNSESGKMKFSFA